MTSHLEESLQRDFDHIRGLITKMTRFAVRTLQECVAALENRDRELASLIILRDQRIDQMEKEIDRLCLEFLVRHQPVGTHLRFAYAALQINFELERVGDYAESIARQIIKLLDLDCRIPAGLFSEITSASISMLHNAVAAFDRQDPDLARVTAQIEERVDVLRNQVNSELMHLVQSNQVPLAALTPLMTIARRFERVSDQAKSICQETIYICTGEYAKHSGAPAYRVLFVDDRHGALSRMAEAIGHGLNRSDFEFASAGIDARPLTPEASIFLQEKGGDALSPPPTLLNELPEFHQYQLVIALSPAAKRQLPTPSRKAVQLAWTVADPEAASGTPEQIRAAYERAHSSLVKQISNLMARLTAEEPTEPISIRS
jgi:phosphate transport system protein